ncbi:DUF4332 domain-containing protein [Myxococcota bacterium]|nr:DUF4332 domain-containing protein [Myxococcota bacterium]
MSYLLEAPETIEGIGPAREEVLRRAKITNLAELFRAGAPRVHRLIPGASAEQVGEWFCKGALMRVEGMTDDLADALVTEGIRSVHALADAELGALEAAAKKGRESGRLRAAPDLHALSALQKRAWKLAGSGMLAGRLCDRNGRGIAGARVIAGDREQHTDEAGWYAFDKLDAGRIRVRIELERRPFPLDVGEVEIRDGKLTGPLRHRCSRDPAPSRLPVVRELDGHLIANTRATDVQLLTRPLEELPEGSLVQVRTLGADGHSRLMSFFKERTGNTIIIPRARVKREELPAGAAVGDVLRWAAGRLEATTLTPKDVAELKRARWEETTKRRTARVIRIRRRGAPDVRPV